MATVVRTSYPSGPPAVAVRLAAGETVPRMAAIGRFTWPLALVGVFTIFYTAAIGAAESLTYAGLGVVWFGILIPVLYGFAQGTATYYLDGRYFAFYLGGRRLLLDLNDVTAIKKSVAGAYQLRAGVKRGAIPPSVFATPEVLAIMSLAVARATASGRTVVLGRGVASLLDADDLLLSEFDVPVSAPPPSRRWPLSVGDAKAGASGADDGPDVIEH